MVAPGMRPTPQHETVIQVAMKTPFDVFYFQQPLDIRGACDKSEGWVDRSQFMSLWQNIGAPLNPQLQC